MEPQENRIKHSLKTDKSIAGLYDLERSLGSGHFAVVKLARHVFTGEKVAVKVIDKTKLDEVAKAHLYQEVRCMKLVQHPNVVRLYEVIDTQTKLYLILEYGDGGDMYDHIMRYEGKGISEDKARHYFKQIVSAIDYCHKLHVVHRDLKPENVIFFKSQDIAKLTDFGFSNSFLPGEKLYTSCGSLAYSAPEILLGDSYDAPAVDVWSLGVILYMMVCGKGPFNHANDSETLTKIMDCDYELPDELTNECKSLISRMLVRLPYKRASLDSIVDDQWLHIGENEEIEKLISPPTKPLISEIHISKEIHLAVLQKMEMGKVASREVIEKSLQDNHYDHVTATYFLIAERILKRRLGSVALHVKLQERHSYPYEVIAKSRRSSEIEAPVENIDSTSSTSSSTFENYPDYPFTNDLTKEQSQSDEYLAESTSYDLNSDEFQSHTLPARSRLSYPPTLYSNKKTKSTPNLLNGITEENESELEDSPRTSPILQRRSSQRRRKYHTCRLSPIHSRRSSCSSSDDDEMHMLAERRRISGQLFASLANSQSTTGNSSNQKSGNGEDNSKEGNNDADILSNLDLFNEDSLSKKISSFFDSEEKHNLMNLLVPTLNLKLGSYSTAYGRHLSDTNLTSYSKQLQLALAKGTLKHGGSNGNISSLSTNQTSVNNKTHHVQTKCSSDTNLLSSICKKKNNILFTSSDFFKTKDLFAKYIKLRHNTTRNSSKNSSNLSLSSPIEEEPTYDLALKSSEEQRSIRTNSNTELFGHFSDILSEPALSTEDQNLDDIIENYPHFNSATHETLMNSMNNETKILHKSESRSTVYMPNFEDEPIQNQKQVELESSTTSKKRVVSTYTNTHRAVQIVPSTNTGSVCCSLV